MVGKYIVKTPTTEKSFKDLTSAREYARDYIDGHSYTYQVPVYADKRRLGAVTYVGRVEDPDRNIYKYDFHWVSHGKIYSLGVWGEAYNGHEPKSSHDKFIMKMAGKY